MQFIIRKINRQREDVRNYCGSSGKARTCEVIEQSSNFSNDGEPKKSKAINCQVSEQVWLFAESREPVHCIYIGEKSVHFCRISLLTYLWSFFLGELENSLDDEEYLKELAA